MKAPPSFYPQLFYFLFQKSPKTRFSFHTALAKIKSFFEWLIDKQRLDNKIVGSIKIQNK